jgi:hypothetical protein
LTQNGLWFGKKSRRRWDAMYAIPIIYAPVLMITDVVGF